MLYVLSGGLAVGSSDEITAAPYLPVVIPTTMDDSISKLLAGLKKPSRRFRQLTVRITATEFLELESYAATRYLNYSDVVREAIAAYLRNPNPDNN